MEPMYDEVPQVVSQAQVEPVDSNPEQLDEQVAALALAVGLTIMQAVADGDLDGLRGFVDEIAKAQRRNRNLERLLSLEHEEIEKLLGSLEQSKSEKPAAPPAEQPAPPPTEAEPPAPVNEREAIRKAVMESPRGANARGGKRSTMRDFFAGG
ncbi:MAG: hypothetical protein CFK49_11895 [Armatimonadetes bacterium JP3_11]|jgi:hypothetical protein|nr:MAG: hypothetical protein CFK48_10335 [Armatimonadetes bacterium CP1_7O]OYT70219.1 MAG: hypothetical protein CFK49_11895 [Armatimonadetes bacterium JP3_11]